MRKVVFYKSVRINIKIQVYGNSKQAHTTLSDNNDIRQSVLLNKAGHNKHHNHEHTASESNKQDNKCFRPTADRASRKKKLQGTLIRFL